MLPLLLELTVYGLLACGTVYCFGLEVDWQQHTVHSRTSECQPGVWGAGARPLLTPPSLRSLHLPPVFPVAEDGDPAHHVAGGGLPCLGTPDSPLEVRGPRAWGTAVRGRPDCTSVPPTRWTQVHGWLQKLYSAVQLSILGTATVALFMTSLVGKHFRGASWGLEGQH